MPISALKTLKVILKDWLDYHNKNNEIKYLKNSKM
jgi:hypothetical protein